MTRKHYSLIAVASLFLIYVFAGISFGPRLFNGPVPVDKSCEDTDGVITSYGLFSAVSITKYYIVDASTNEVRIRELYSDNNRNICPETNIVEISMVWSIVLAFFVISFTFSVFKIITSEQ